MNNQVAGVNTHFMTASSETSSNQNDNLSTAVTPKPGSVVTIECTLLPEADVIPEPIFDGIVLHPADPPKRLSFVLGEGNYLPGLHEIVSSMTFVGEIVEATLDAGWGDRNPDLQVTIQFADLDKAMDKSNIKEGVQLLLSNGLKAFVTAVDDETFTMDANPPLAGASYKATVTLLSVEEGPPETVYPADDNDNTSRFQVATVALGT